MHQPLSAKLSSSTVLISVLLAGLFANATSAQKGVFFDPVLGIKIKAPSRWSYMGKLGDRGALRALYTSPRFFASKAQRGISHTPTMRVLWFPKAKGDAKKKVAESEFPMLTPYTSLKDYMTRVYSKLQQVSVDSGAIGKMNGRLYVLTASGNREAALTLHIATVPMQDGELAIEYECLTEQHKKLKPQFEKSLLTLTASARKPATAVEPPAWEANREAWMKKGAGERAKARAAWGKAWMKQRQQGAEDGWKPYKTKHYLILTRADSKFSKRVVKAIDIVRTWVEALIGDMTDEAIMPAVIRIFADERELLAYRLRDREQIHFEPRTRELYFFKDASKGNTGGGFGGLVLSVFYHVLHDKHPHTRAHLPRWIENGLPLYMNGGLIKRKKLSFTPDKFETDRFNHHKSKNYESMAKVWAFMQEQFERPKEDKDNFGFDVVYYGPGGVKLIRWLNDGGGSKAFGKERLFPLFLKAAGNSAAKAALHPGANVDYNRLDEAQRTTILARIDAWRVAHTQKVNDSVIPMSPDAWMKIDAAFRAYIQSADK